MKVKYRSRRKDSLDEALSILSAQNRLEYLRAKFWVAKVFRNRRALRVIGDRAE